MALGKTGLSSIIEDWELVNNDFSQLENSYKAYSKSVEDFKKLETQCNKGIENQLKGITRILQALRCFRPSSEEEKEEQSDLKKILAVRKEELKDMHDALPRKSGLYLGIVLGSVNVTLLNEDAKFKYKDEYERFKLAVTMCVLFFSFMNIIVSYRALDAVLHFLLLWYYCTLTIRESILRVNGSRIKGWWRTHHFITTVLAGVLILWPDGKTYQMFRKQFMWYSCYSSFLQVLMYNYQQGCLYRLRSLGERYNMDITIDGFHSWMWRGLTFLLPFLTIGYAWQLFNSYSLFMLGMLPECVEWQVLASAAIFLVLFTGNTATTVMVVRQKLNFKDLFLRKPKKA